MRQWRDVCLWHDADYICHHEAFIRKPTQDVLLYLCREKNEAYDAWNEHRIFYFFSTNNAAVIRTLLHYIKAEPN